MKFASKRELVDSITGEHRVLVELLDAIVPARFAEPGVWGDGWSLDDLLSHLTAWEQLFLGWFRAGLEGEDPDLPAPGYKWNQTPALNREIWRRHRGKDHRRVRADFEASYEEIVDLVGRLSEAELLDRGRFAWTGRHPLATYLAPNTCSHYRTAAKIVKRWLRGERRPVPDPAPESGGRDAAAPPAK